MKIISVNIEDFKHEKTVFEFLTREDADVVCLQEFPHVWCEKLETLGYHTSFAPMCLRSSDPRSLSGLALASKSPQQTESHYYYKSAAEITIYRSRIQETIAHPVIIGTVAHNDTMYTIATTHMIVTLDGKENDQQRAGMEKLLSILEAQPPHIVCGDFNMPRGHNTLYELVTEKYSDTIPTIYRSSLDKSLHRLGDVKNLDQPIFDEYMVDYIFTQPPYSASNVRLEFGISDHAAVVATLQKK
jgi:exonuclease III